MSLLQAMVEQKVSVELKIEFWIALLWLAHPDCTDCHISDSADENVLPELVRQLIDVYQFAADNGFLNKVEIENIFAKLEVKTSGPPGAPTGESLTNWES